MNLIPKRFYFDDLFDDVMSSRKDMKCDIYEKNGIYNIEMDMPGFDKKDINIEMKNDYLTITASKEEEKTKKETIFVKKEAMLNTNALYM